MINSNVDAGVLLQLCRERLHCYPDRMVKRWLWPLCDRKRGMSELISHVLLNGAVDSTRCVAVMLLMLVVIVVLVLFVVTRRRRKEPLLPRNIADFGRTMRQSMHFGNDYDNSAVMFRNNLVSLGFAGGSFNYFKCFAIYWWWLTCMCRKHERTLAKVVSAWLCFTKVRCYNCQVTSPLSDVKKIQCCVHLLYS